MEQLAATDYLTNPYKLKKMNDKLSVWILNTQVFARDMHLAGVMSKTT